MVPISPSLSLSKKNNTHTIALTTEHVVVLTGEPIQELHLTGLQELSIGLIQLCKYMTAPHNLIVTCALVLVHPPYSTQVWPQN